jgi:hypothetical protein
MQISPENEYNPVDSSINRTENIKKSTQSKKVSIFQFQFLKPKFSESNNEELDDKRKSFLNKIQGKYF